METSGRRSVLALALLVAGAATSCGEGHERPPVAAARFAVLSDPHLYDAATLGGGSAELRAYAASGGEMVEESAEILDAVLADLSSRGLDFVLVSGDLTKDGERVDHELMASKLAALTAAGTQVLVVPGNHDVENPAALSYATSPPAPVAGVSAEDFRRIYRDHGYGRAIATDPSSLSYLAEPVPGIWILALDSCRYGHGTAGPETAGGLGAATQDWAAGLLGDARRRGKLVIALEHHGMVEHFAGQATRFPEFLLADFGATGKRLADAGLRVVFTGHFHANDVTRADFDASFLYDVETGSTVTAPSAYRLVDVDVPARTLALSTAAVKAIPSHPDDFADFSRERLVTSVTALAVEELTHSFLAFDEATASELASLVASVAVAHFAGDERLDADPALSAAVDGLLASPDLRKRIVGQALVSALTDLPPGDDLVEISLR